MKFSSLDGWLHWQEGLHSRPVELGLERVRRVWSDLGQGLAPLPPVITVAGTNGKGSCVAFLEAVLRAAGHAVGAYTSPHLVRYNERIRIRGEMARDRDIMAAFQRVEDARGDTSLTYFEFGTLAALDLFARAALDVLVLEVGLGGRLDAVNLVDADVALVTNVAIDHVAWLGEDREAIGREKAGIFRPGRPAIYAQADPPASLVASARSLGTPLYRAGEDFSFSRTSDQWEFLFHDFHRRALPLPAMRGRHQLENAAGALAALHLLRGRLAVNQQAVREGLVRARLPGRFQVIPGPPRVVLDVAHNPAGVDALAANLKTLLPAGRRLAVFGALADKDIRSMAGELRGLIHHWYAAPPGDARAPEAERLFAEVSAAGVDRSRVSGFESIAAALKQALRSAAPEDTVVVFGSFLSVAEALDCLEPKQ